MRRILYSYEYRNLFRNDTNDISPLMFPYRCYLQNTEASTPATKRAGNILATLKRRMSRMEMPRAMSMSPPAAVTSLIIASDR